MVVKHIGEKVDEDVCKMFTWVRISINVFFDWENRIGHRKV